MFLAIDASQPLLWVALGDQVEAVERHASSELSHSEELGAIVDELLTSRSLKISQLSGVIVGNGPGSFTGLRIGYSFAKGVCLAAKIPLIEASTFEAMALEFLDSAKDVHVIADARRDEAFVATYSRSSKTAARIIPVAELTRYAGVFVAATAVEAERLGVKGARIPKNPAASLIKLGGQAGRINQQNVRDLAEITPFYLRQVAAKSIAERT